MLTVDLPSIDDAQKSTGDADITLYLGDHHYAAQFKKLRRELQTVSSSPVSATVAGNTCRGHACWCQGRKAIALTLRKHKQASTTATPNQLPELLPALAAAPDTLATLITKSVQESQRPDPEPLKGVIVVCGETGSGKTTLADGLIRKLAPFKDGGHNHVIVLGNPIEWRTVNEDCKPCGLSNSPDLTDCFPKLGIRVTPRVLGEDTDLDPALKDALRQKPTVVYIEEVRDDQDWKPILRFAESGHLVITTAHAGSVRDALSWILRSMGVQNRSQAPAVAKNILAVIHAQFSPGSSIVRKQEPEIWLGARGARLLGAYGPGALIPNNDVTAAYIARNCVRQLLTTIAPTT